MTRGTRGQHEESVAVLCSSCLLSVFGHTPDELSPPFYWGTMRKRAIGQKARDFRVRGRQTLRC